jgi:hypothetical protein
MLALTASKILIGLVLWVTDVDAASCGENDYGTLYTEGASTMCLRREATTRSYEDARVRCKALGGYLTMVRNSDEQKIVLSIFQNQNTWIGANDINSEGTFVWGVNQALVTYQAYASGEPNDYGTGEDCVQMWDREKGQWNDDRCSRTRASICEFVRVTPVATPWAIMASCIPLAALRCA